MQFSASQKKAFDKIINEDRVFLTGGAGTGKSFLIREFLQDKDPKSFPVLASTGAAAVLIGGRTFHSFFGLGIMEGGFEATIEKALKDNKLCGRLQALEGFVLDEVSMIPASAFRAAEAICRLTLDPSTPWGGLKVIAVGDFFQLPPVNLHSQAKDWCFLDDAWNASAFVEIELNENMRASEMQFLSVLKDLRAGRLTSELQSFLNSRMIEPPEEEDLVHLYPRKAKVEEYNLIKLEDIDDSPVVYKTEYHGEKRYLEQLKKVSPVPEELVFKMGAFVMIRQNDPVGRFVNGSLGYIRELYDDLIEIELVNKRFVRLEKTNFSMQNADGHTVAVARNFPLSLAYSTTIHKAQGSTIDKLLVDIASLWEPGHAYVALSRATDPNHLYISNWDEKSIRVSRDVQNYYKSF